MDDLKSKAKAAFDHNKGLNLVHVTSDGQVFTLPTDAQLHASEHKLEDKAVTPFTRDEANDVVTLEDTATLIPKIKDAKTVEEIFALVNGTDTRPDVLTAVTERESEIRAFISGAEQPGIIYRWI